MTVPLFLIDESSVRARALLAALDAPIVSDWCVVEVSGVVARQARIGAISANDAQIVLANFDKWRSGITAADTSSSDLKTCVDYVRRTDFALRGPDALHIAICRRLGARLATFDARMAAAARALGIETVP